MLDFQRRLLYELKRQYGTPISLYVQQVGEPNLQTGKRSTTQTVYSVPLAIVVPAKFFSQGVYSAAFLKAGRDFAYNAYQTVDSKAIILDAADLPSGFEVVPDQHVTINGKRYEIYNVEGMNGDAGFILMGKRLTGVPPEEVRQLGINQKFRMNQTVSVVRVHVLSVTQTLVISDSGGASL